jgi:pyruvate,water dikinase
MNYIRWFEEISSTDIDKVGGKGANLGVMAGADFPVPPGFCLTAQAYREFIERTNLGESIQDILAEIDHRIRTRWRSTGRIPAHYRTANARRYSWRMLKVEAAR